MAIITLFGVLAFFVAAAAAADAVAVAGAVVEFTTDNELKNVRIKKPRDRIARRSYVTSRFVF